MLESLVQSSHLQKEERKTLKRLQTTVSQEREMAQSNPKPILFSVLYSSDMDSGWKLTWHCNSIDLTLMMTRLLLQMMVIRMSVRGFWEVC